PTPSIFSRSAPPRPSPPRFPYTTLFRSRSGRRSQSTYPRWALPNFMAGLFLMNSWLALSLSSPSLPEAIEVPAISTPTAGEESRSEEHTSELQSRFDLVCRLLLEKKNHQ